MQAKINIYPAKFERGFFTIEMSSKPLLSETVDAKNGAELRQALETFRAPFMDQSHYISILPKSRKFRGFDKWESENKSILRNNRSTEKLAAES